MEQKQRKPGELWRYIVASLLTLLIFVLSAEDTWPFAQWWLPQAIVNGAAAVVALWSMRFRHRRPVTLAIALAVASALFPAVSVSSLWAYLSLSTHRKWRAIISVGILSVAIDVTRSWLRGDLYVVKVVDEPGRWLSLGATVAFSVIFMALIAGWGSYIGARRDTKHAERERLSALFREQELRAETARAEERTRLAREMHDVLAHKLSLITMHAGALAYRDDIDPVETKSAATTIHQSSQQALAELRMILGSLRQVESTGAAAPPQPEMKGIAELIEDHRQAGEKIVASISVEGQAAAAVGRHTYRIVQEALTNASRHAPGTTVQVTVEASPATGVSIQVRNPLSLSQQSSQGSGLGLVGMKERVDLLGGSMRAEKVGGYFELEVQLPWRTGE